MMSRFQIHESYVESESTWHCSHIEGILHTLVVGEWASFFFFLVVGPGTGSRMNLKMLERSDNENRVLECFSFSFKKIVLERRILSTYAKHYGAPKLRFDPNFTVGEPSFLHCAWRKKRKVL